MITGGSVTFNGTVDNGQNLDSKFSRGNNLCRACRERDTALTSITTRCGRKYNNKCSLNNNNSGEQTYNDAVTLTVDTVITGAVPSFAGVTGGNHDLT